MNRADDMMRILQANANFQWNIALMLEAQASEVQKSSNWMCNHLTSTMHASHEEHVEQTIHVHEQVIQTIDALTRMEMALGKNMEVLLGEEEADNVGNDSLLSMANLFGGNAFDDD